MHFIIATFINLILVSIVFLIHYEVLSKLAKFIPMLTTMPPRFRVFFRVSMIFNSHVIEIWIFAFGYFITLNISNMGSVVNSQEAYGAFWDCVYLSFITFTTVGYGDVVPRGMIRYLTGIEALAGLILITWSASFLFIEMQKYWVREPKHKNIE